jgi:chemotaxis regulatin CheY-phosphate phosphatase CheZ
MHSLESEYMLKKQDEGKIKAMEAIIKMDEELADFLEKDIEEQQQQSNDWWKDELKEDPRRKIVKLIRSSIEQKKSRIKDIKKLHNLE